MGKNYRELLTTPFRAMHGMTTPAEYFNRMGTPDFDFAKYRDGGMLEAILELSENWIVNSGDEGQFCDATIEYWRSRGLKKELCRAEGGDYVLFTPLSMYTEEGKGRKYPLIFTICGFNDDIYAVETLGFTHLAAEEELIQVLPLMYEPTREPSLDRDRPYDLLDRLCAELPVDEERIYMTGFSHGGILSQWNCIGHTERFAGAAAAGIRPGDGAPRRSRQGFQRYYEYNVTPEVQRMHVPIVYCIGMEEQPHHLPLYRGTTIEHFEHYVDEHVDHLKYITAMNETPPLALEDLMACKNSAAASERAIGVPLINTHTDEYYGVRHYFGDVASSDGVIRTRYIGVENQPHHPSAAWARLSWDFLRHFRRDPVTHESIYEE